MNATKRSTWIGMVCCSSLAITLAGCVTHVVERPPRTVYVPAPPPPAVVVTQPAPAAPPPPMIIESKPEPAPVVVIHSENDFYEPLTAYGRWVVVGSYGRCWVPARVEAGWRPYANGYWQRTDAGWYWTSEEPWGWATYHYGRWDFTAEFGWIWVPQTQWAPAWVAWREGGGYVGWAPLRPSVAIGVNVTRVDYEPAFAARAFVFVEHRRMLEHVRPHSVAVNTTTIINRTVNITNVKVVNQEVINEGPRTEVIERESGHRIQAVPAREFRHREETAAAARERNLPTASNRSSGAPDHNLPKTVEPQRPANPGTTPAERPAQVVTQPVQPARPVVAPGRPTAPPPAENPPVRAERKAEPVAEKRVTIPTSQPPKNTPSSNPPQTFPPRSVVRRVESPATTKQPDPRPVATTPANRNGINPESTSQPRNTTPPPAVDNRSRPTVRPAAIREENSKAPGKVEPAKPAAVREPTVRGEKSTVKRILSPREKSRGAAPGEADDKKQ